MSCNTCSSDIKSSPKGCKSNGHCTSGSCEKLTVFDWLSNMAIPTGQSPVNIVEVRFKNGRKHFYKKPDNLSVAMGDVVAVEGNPGHDIGTVSLTGELVKVQMKRKQIDPAGEAVKKIYRKASQRDIDNWKASRDKEYETQYKGREIISRLGLKMKLSDVEYQGDGNKATFYYTAEGRVDFRQLIKDLAVTFGIRIEMKQVGLREEAARLGGVGSCGRELCCSTWLTDLRKVNTAAARYQQLSLNPQKLAGQCGKLKCCLNYELDTYLDALSAFPKQELPLQTDKGKAVFVKMDIFKEMLWYAYKEERGKWYQLSLDQVNEIIAINKKGETIPSLEDYEFEQVGADKTVFENVVGQDSLTRFDAPKKGKRRRHKGRNRKQAVKRTASKTTGHHKKGAEQPPKNNRKKQRRKPPGKQAKPNA